MSSRLLKCALLDVFFLATAVSTPFVTGELNWGAFCEDWFRWLFYMTLVYAILSSTFTFFRLAVGREDATVSLVCAYCVVHQKVGLTACVLFFIWGQIL